MLQQVQANGITMAVRVQGAGPPVVFIHGHGFESSSWQPQLDYFGRSYRAIAYDLRGHGLTEVATSGYTVGEFAADLARLLDVLEVERAVLCGLSMGGMIAMQAAVDFPARVAGLVLANTALPAAPPPAEQLLDRLRSLYADGLTKLADDVGALYFGKRFREEKPDFRTWWRDRFLRNDLAGLTGGILAMSNRPNIRDRLEALGFPALVIGGEEDQVTPPAAARQIVETMRGAELVLLPETGHIANEERPQEFNRIVAGFLERIGWQGTRREPAVG